MHKYYIKVSFKQVINTKLIPTSSILCIMWVSEGITMSSYTQYYYRSNMVIGKIIYAHTYIVQTFFCVLIVSSSM